MMNEQTSIRKDEGKYEVAKPDTEEHWTGTSLKLYAFQWNNVLCQSYCGHITIIARNIDEARANYKAFTAQYKVNSDLVEFDYLGDIPIGDGCSVIFDNDPDSVIDLAHVISEGKALIIGCLGSS